MKKFITAHQIRNIKHRYYQENFLCKILMRTKTDLSMKEKLNIHISVNVKN